MAENINNSIEGLTLPHPTILTEEDKALNEERLENRKRIIGDDAFEKEQKEQTEAQEALEKDGYVEDGLSGANTADLKKRFEEGEKFKAEVALETDKEAKRPAEVTTTQSSTTQTQASTPTTATTQPPTQTLTTAPTLMPIENASSTQKKATPNTTGDAGTQNTESSSGNEGGTPPA